MWKRRNPEENIRKSTSEVSIDRRDKSIRVLVDELAAGTQELKSLLYPGDSNDRTKPA